MTSGRSSKLGSFAANSLPPPPCARGFRVKRPKSFAIFIRWCASLHCPNRKRKAAMNFTTGEIGRPYGGRFSHGPHNRNPSKSPDQRKPVSTQKAEETNSE